MNLEGLYRDGRRKPRPAAVAGLVSGLVYRPDLISEAEEQQRPP
jgi:hypothetical protein